MSPTYVQDSNHPWHVCRYGFSADVMERYDYREGKWVRDLDLYDIAVDKYWELEEITAKEAAAIVGKREEEMATKEETQDPRSAPMGALLRRR